MDNSQHRHHHPDDCRIPDSAGSCSSGGQYSGEDSQSKKRRRKSTRQLEILLEEFSKDEEWSKEKISAVAVKTGLSESQVYKWCWDQKKKISSKNPDCKENMRPDSIEQNLNRINTVKEKAELLERLGKRRRPFMQVNDSRIEDST